MLISTDLIQDYRKASVTLSNSQVTILPSKPEEKKHAIT